LSPASTNQSADLLAEERDEECIRTPEVSLDREATDRDEARAHEIFDGILEGRMQGWTPWFLHSLAIHHR
jgi:hypothetical protein